jgi:hypothetical protein
MDNDNGDRTMTDPVIGSAAMPSLFLGNLYMDFSPEEIQAVFEQPFQPPPSSASDADSPMTKQWEPVPVDHVDVKRGYCFVFLKDAKSQADKERVEAYVKAIQGV